MALEIHTVELRAKDSMSPVFKNVGAAASRSAKDVTDSFARAGESTRRFNVAAAALGSAIGASVGILADFSRAAAEDAAGQARLQQAIENTGKSYDQYSDSVDKAIKKGQDKAFSDDATREALVRLTTVTGDAGKSLDQLGLVMDFARARGISLADSASVIAKVMGGNVGILQRYGIAIEDGATATEALALIQARSAGQADVYASSQLGQLDKMRDKWAELAESIGANTGELQQFLLLLPGLSSAGTAISGIIAGMGGIGAATQFLSAFGALGIGAGIAYLATDALINQGATGSRTSFTAVNYGLYGAGSALNAVLPGNPFDTQKYMDTLASNSIEDVIKGLFYFSPTDSVGNRELFDRLRTAGIIKGDAAPEGSKGDKYIQDQFLAIQRAAGQQGLTTGQYIQGQLSAPGSNFVFDNVSGRWMDLGEYQIYQEARKKAAATSSATVYGPPQPYNGPFQPNGGTAMNPARYYGDIEKGPTGMAVGGAASKDMSGFRTGPADSATYSADAARAAIVREAGAYGILFDGVIKATDATDAFKVTQDGLIGQQAVYSQQVSEYNSQLSAMDAAHEILNQRQADGIALTQDQIEFQNNYNHAKEIGTGAVEDATLAEGMLGQQYLLNKEKMDASKESQDAYTGATMDLVGIIGDLIFALEGVPTEVKTQIMLEDLASGRIDEYYQKLNALNGYSVTTYINTVMSDPNLALHQHGGIVAAQHGRVLGGNYTLVGEAGPELLAGGAGRGGMVIPASATRAMMRDKGSGGGAITINGPVNVYANDPMQFQQQLRSSNVMEARW